MKNDAQKAFHMGPLQKGTVTPILDPAERAALRESVNRSRMAALTGTTDDGVPCEPTLPLMVDLCRQLSAEDRLALVTELVAQLSTEQRLELKERLKEVN